VNDDSRISIGRSDDDNGLLSGQVKLRKPEPPVPAIDLASHGCAKRGVSAGNIYSTLLFDPPYKDEPFSFSSHLLREDGSCTMPFVTFPGSTLDIGFK
jgi:hypothetical protein